MYIQKGAGKQDQKLVDSINKINRLYKRAKPGKETRFSFINSEMRGHKISAQFVLYRKRATYAEMLKVVADYVAESAIQQEPSIKVIKDKFSASTLLQNEVGKVSILKRQDIQSFHIEERVDKLVYQLAEL